MTLLEHVGIKRADVRIGNAILCGPISEQDKQDPRFKDVLHRCAERRAAEGDLGSATTILAAGSMAAHGLLGEPIVLGGRQPRRGALHRDSQGRAVFPTWHPAAILRAGGDNTKGGKKGGGGLSDAEVETLGFDIERSWQFSRGERSIFRPTVQITDNPSTFVSWVRANALSAKRVAIDVETDSVDPTTANLLLVGLAVTTAAGERRVISFWWPSADSTAIAILRELLTKEGLEKAFHNLGFDVLVLERKVGPIVGPFFDTLLAMHAAFPECKLDLGSVGHTFFVLPPWKFNFRSWERSHKKDVADRSEEWRRRNAEYNAWDSAVTDALVDSLRAECTKRAVLQVHDLDVKLALHARKMTERGLYVSPEIRAELHVEFVEKERKASEKLQRLVLEGVENGLASGRHSKEIEQLLLSIQKSSNKGLRKSYWRKLKKAKKPRKSKKMLAALAASLALAVPHAASPSVSEQPATGLLPSSLAGGSPRPAENRPAESNGDSGMVPVPPDGVLVASQPDQKPNVGSATSISQAGSSLGRSIPPESEIEWVQPPAPEKIWSNKAWNPLSPIQLRLAYDICDVQLPANMLTKNGQRSMSKHALVQIFDHPLVGATIELRKNRRFLSVYFESKGSTIAEDNRLRVGWKVHGTPTGRWSSGGGGRGVGEIGIALQNWPPVMRKMIVAPDGMKLCGADYNALEFRMIALLSGETVLLDIFNNTTVKRDLHAENTARLYPSVWASLDPTRVLDQRAARQVSTENVKLIQKLHGDSAKLSDEAIAERLGFDPWTVGKVLENVGRRTLMRKFVKTGFYAAVYGAVPPTVQAALRAQSLKETDQKFARMLREVSLKDCKMFVDAVPRFWPALARWRDRQVAERSRSGKWVSPIDGRRRVWLMARSERSAYINSPVQGCLHKCARVLTDSGYVEIGELAASRRSTTAWTGRRWASATASDQGLATLAEVYLSDGTIVRCDVRHELLVLTPSGYAWTPYAELRPGLQVASALVRDMDFDSKPVLPALHRAKKTCRMPQLPEDLHSDLWYWLGHYMGNGHLSKTAGSFQCTFGRHRRDLAERCAAFWSCFNVKAMATERTRVDDDGKTEGAIAVTWNNRSLSNWLRLLGFAPADAHTKRVPSRVFTESHANRIEFVRGFIDSDGEWPDPARKNPNLHLCQRPLLEDMKLLLRMLGVESRLIGPLEYQGATSYRLDIFWRMLERLLGEKPSERSDGWLSTTGDRAAQRQILPRAAKLRAPRFLIASFLRALDGHKPSVRMPDYTPSARTLVSRLRHGGHVSVYTLDYLTRLFGVEMDEPIYVPQEIVEVRELDRVERTYTLTVDDLEHRFDAEGVITKNCSGSLMNRQTLLLMDQLAPLSRDIHLILQVHDSLVFEVPTDLAARVQKVVEDTLTTTLELDGYSCLFPVEAATGDSWYVV